jgi:uncharacterized protein with ParB-like and HNH nuclease domain
MHPGFVGADMRTTATNRKVRLLLTALRDKKLDPSPEFQRRLVWTNKDKVEFLRTVLDGYPFPEIYVAAGDVDLESGEGQEMLVDGQQRVTTLYHYFVGSDDLRLGPDMTPYKELPEEDKEAFLQYDVVVRDLGKLPMQEIKEIFQRINATAYSLNAMEIHNARFDGAFKKFGEKVAQLGFFEANRVFSAAEVRRMNDTRFALSFIITLMSTYFNRDEELEPYLRQYNDEFRQSEEVFREIKDVLKFIDKCELEPKSRVWKKADLFTLIVETHRLIFKEEADLDAKKASEALKEFYEAVDSLDTSDESDTSTAVYARAALQATNDRGNRIKRGSEINKILRNAL